MSRDEWKFGANIMTMSQWLQSERCVSGWESFFQSFKKKKLHVFFLYHWSLHAEIKTVTNFGLSSQPALALIRQILTREGEGQQALRARLWSRSRCITGWLSALFRIRELIDMRHWFLTVRSSQNFFFLPWVRSKDGCGVKSKSRSLDERFLSLIYT